MRGYIDYNTKQISFEINKSRIFIIGKFALNILRNNDLKKLLSSMVNELSINTYSLGV